MRREAMNSRPDLERSMGLAGATGVGVGAIVGGGILALAGVAFAATGPAAIVAFALNGLIALVTALSFAELATRFPESGGTYAFARKVLSIRAAFTVGWVVWFASIVAATLYAFGFGAFALIVIVDVTHALGGQLPDWFAGRLAIVVLAVGAVGVYALGLLRTAGGGAPWVNIGKVAVFGILIAAGLWKLAGTPPATIGERLSPFFSGGAAGLIQAMGFTFIAMQGFDLIAAVGGEVRDPKRTIPRAMFLSLAIALAIYLPLLLVIATVGVAPGQAVTALGAGQPEAVVAIAARNYLGGFGYWLVIVAGVLSMLSALRANLLAASRVALAMARDRTLPHWMALLSTRRRTPAAAVLSTAVLVVLVLLAIPDVAAGGAAASLVFLITFALAHRVSILARRRGDRARAAFRVPWFPYLPGGQRSVGRDHRGRVARVGRDALRVGLRRTGADGGRLQPGARRRAGPAARPQPAGARADRQPVQRRGDGGRGQRARAARRRTRATPVGRDPARRRRGGDRAAVTGQRADCPPRGAQRVLCPQPRPGGAHDRLG
jgi:amino acid transporter